MPACEQIAAEVELGDPPPAVLSVARHRAMNHGRLPPRLTLVQVSGIRSRISLPRARAVSADMVGQCDSDALGKVVVQ